MRRLRLPRRGKHHLPFALLGDPPQRDDGGSIGDPVCYAGDELGIIPELERFRADPAAEQLLKYRVLLQIGDEAAGVGLGRRRRHAVDFRVDDTVADAPGGVDR